MKIIMLAGSCLMLIAAALMIIVQIKRKKRITAPYVILSIITFVIALRMIGKMVGIEH